MIEYVSRSAPALVPLFRSEQQLSLLGVLFAQASEDLTIGELARRAGVAQATASREVARLAEHGLVQVRSLGRNTLVAANWDLPWAKELRALLTQTIGVLGRLGDALGELAGIEAAFVFGSWAARYTGAAGPAPRDVDVVVVGTASLPEVRDACRTVEHDLRLDVNPVVFTHDEWRASTPDPFIEELRSGPLVEIPLPRSA
jgi:DNA-binding transcriptional ArsR family regulator